MKKFGVREICDVVLKAKSAQKIGNKVFYKNEPIIYFDTLKTSSLEGSASTVYATGGRGNTRLVAWEGERTLTFNMEDALISPEGFMILSGAGLVDSSEKKIYQHITETVDASEGVKVEGQVAKISLQKKPYLPADKGANYAYVMFIKDGEIVSEPFIPLHEEVAEGADGSFVISVKAHKCYDTLIDNQFETEDHENDAETAYSLELEGDDSRAFFDFTNIAAFDSVLVDYYVEHDNDGTQQIEITADKFGGNYYLEASTLFRDTNGVDMPAEFIIPNCKIQSNFNFNMSSSGDPSTFNFVLDAFPDYTRFDHSKKVLATIQIIKDSGSATDIHRHSTVHEVEHDKLF